MNGEIKGTYTIEKTFIGKDKIPALISFHKQKQTLPAVICLHGWSANKEGMLKHCLRTADSGFFTIAIDARMHGERLDPAFLSKSAENFPYTFFSVVTETAKDLTQVVDFLEKRPEVDQNQLGLKGISMGAFISLIATQFEKRVKAVASILGAGDFHLFGKKVSSQKVLPSDQQLLNHLDEETERLIRKYDPLKHLKKFHPTALLLMGGSQDPLIPKEGIIQLYGKLKPLYASNSENIKLKMYDVGHAYTEDMEAEVIQWLKEHL